MYNYLCCILCTEVYTVTIIIITVRRCAIIGNKHFELRSSGVVKRSIDEASLYPDGNEFKKYQQSKSPVNFADELSDNTTALAMNIRFQWICVAIVISHVTGMV